MKYEKPEVEVVAFDFAEFMTSSGTGDPTPTECTGYTDSVGHSCGTYSQGGGCGSWSTPSFGGGSCNRYDGHKCYGYTDNRGYCAEYGISCGKF